MLHGERSWSKNSTNHTNIDSLSYLICIIKISNGLNFSANRLHSLFWFWESTRIWCLISVQHNGSKKFLYAFTKILVTFYITYRTQTMKTMFHENIDVTTLQNVLSNCVLKTAIGLEQYIVCKQNKLQNSRTFQAVEKCVSQCRSLANNFTKSCSNFMKCCKYQQ